MRATASSAAPSPLSARTRAYQRFSRINDSASEGVLNSSRTIRAAWRTTVFFLKVLPMMPSGALDRVTPDPMVERLSYPTNRGLAESELYRPASAGPHPGMVVCLGVVPFEVDHPQVPRLGEALARAGYAALLYWSPAMRDLRLDPEDVDNIAFAYDALLERPDIDPDRSGLLGTCVGGSFALMAAAHPLIRDRVGFVDTFAPYASMSSLAVAIASSTRSTRNGRQHWPVDQLTRSVYIRSLTAELDPREAELIRDDIVQDRNPLDRDGLSEAGRAVAGLLRPLSPEDAADALLQLPDAMQDRLGRLSPTDYLDEISAPLIIIGHDVDDVVIPIDESRRLGESLSKHDGLRYTEFGMFQHADPTKKKLPLPRLLREFGKFYMYVYPVFRQAVGAA